MIEVENDSNKDVSCNSIENQCLEILNESNSLVNVNTNSYEDTIKVIMEENKELRGILIDQQKQISELIPKVGNNNTTLNNTNNFNLNLFLNEQCKDAVNLIDFINSLQVEFAQIEYTGANGFVEGMSNIFNKAIRNMEITKRPIHCTDLKREILYVKDNEVWEKDDQNKEKVIHAIGMVNQNNLSKISQWVRETPSAKI